MSRKCFMVPSVKYHLSFPSVAHVWSIVIMITDNTFLLMADLYIRLSWDTYLLYVYIIFLE